MKTYEETQEICKSFYEMGKRFWKSQGNPFPESAALQDTSRLIHDPYSPNGDKLDRKAVIDFCEYEANNY